MDRFGIVNELNLAIRSDDKDRFNSILDAGVCINLFDKWGETPLGEAVHFMRYDFLISIINHPEIDINLPSEVGKKYPPIHKAIFFANLSDCSEPRMKVIDILIAAGADPGIETEEGKTAYDLATPKVLAYLTSVVQRHGLSKILEERKNEINADHDAEGSVLALRLDRQNSLKCQFQEDQITILMINHMAPDPQKQKSITNSPDCQGKWTAQVNTGIGRVNVTVNSLSALFGKAEQVLACKQNNRRSE